MSTIASLDELIEYEGSKWEDYDPSRPIIDMIRIIKFQRGVGDQANASGQYKLAFSHYSRARYVLSALRDHPGYGRLVPEDIADIYEHTDYLDEVLRTVIFVPQSGSGNVWAKAPGSDQWGLGEGERSLPRETPRVGDNNHDLRLGYRQVIQASPPTLLHRQDSRSRASQRYFQASPDSNSSHGQENLGYDRAASHNHWMDESAEQKYTTGYPSASFRQVGADGTSHNSDYLASLASSVAQLNIGASSPIPPSTLVAPQPQSFYTYNSQSNRGLGSRASSKGPPRADHSHGDIARPSTTSGNYHQGPYAGNRARSSQSNSPQDYHSAPMSRIQVDNLGRERTEPAVQWPLDPTYAGDLEPMHYDTYRGPGGNYNPENSGSYRARERNLSVGNLARIVPQPSTLIESNERYPSSSRAHPVRKRSLSDSGNYHMDPNISVDSMDYYTANAEFLTGFRQVATATLTRELGYDHPETIDSLELDAIDQMEQTNWQKAETLLTDVLDRRRQTQGNSHLLTIQSMSNLGWAYQGQGKLEHAVAIFNTALNELRKHNSETNWRIISDIQNRLKITRDKQGDRRDFAYSNRTADKTSTDMAAASGTNSLRRLGLQPMISSATTPEEIMVYLTSRGCPDLTNSLDSSQCALVNSNGGYGDIWRGILHNQNTSVRPTHVALKRLRKEKRMYKHICYELYTWSKTSHPNVLELLGIAWFKNRLVMISPWMECGNIEDYVNDHPTVDRLALSLQVVHGVNHLHKIPLVHGDLKARNIFVSGDGVAKVGDFGLAELLGEQSLRFSASGTQSFGTIRWTAPELFEEQPHRGLASDIYALGMTLLEIVTGRVPFHELSVREVMTAVILRHAKPRKSWEVQTMGRHGSNLWAVLNACWNRVPEQRPSADLILEWVERIIYERSLRAQ